MLIMHLMLHIGQIKMFNKPSILQNPLTYSLKRHTHRSPAICLTAVGCILHTKKWQELTENQPFQSDRPNKMSKRQNRTHQSA